MFLTNQLNFISIGFLSFIFPIISSFVKCLIKKAVNIILREIFTLVFFNLFIDKIISLTKSNNFLSCIHLVNPLKFKLLFLPILYFSN